MKTLSGIASHYKVLVNVSEANNFCFMPTLNTSTVGAINQILKYPQGAPLSDWIDWKFSCLAVNIHLCVCGMTIICLIGVVSIIDKVLRSESITPAIISLF